jgi:tetratricopeptide (TPR) repeat protein
VNRRRLLFWALSLLSVVFAVRAFYGLVAGISFSEGRRLARMGQYERALPFLDRAAVGELLPEARWLAGEVRLGLWQQEIDAESDPQDVEAILAAAYVDASAALAASPASGWHWMALGNLYHQAERLSAHRHGVPLSLMGKDPWALVGRPGRIAIGMMRIGLAREPNWYLFRDQLAYVYYDYLLLDETYDAVYESALALPVYELHAYRTLRPQDPDILDAFARGALDSLGRVPWMRPVRHRVALGRLEVRRANWVEAEAHLRQALELDGIELNVAEAQYYLGLSLKGQGRFEEARQALIEAEKQPPLALLSVVAQAELAERFEQPSEALSLWARANRLDPHRLDISLRLSAAALAAEEPERVIHTLREAVRLHPTATEPLVQLLGSYIDQGDLRKARIALPDLESLSPEHPSLPGLREKLGLASAP